MANMTDEELDRDWKPNGRRPQSTIARSFSQELMDIFRIENSVADLDEKLDKRKHQVQNQTSELEQLEQRIREMEDRLRRSQTHFQRPSLQTQAAASQQQQEPSQADDGAAPPPPLPKDLPEKSRQRPLTARQQQHAPSSANMPPTPVASEDGDGEQD